MILFLIIYLSLSASIAYLFSLFFKKRIIKIFVFSFFVALMATFGLEVQEIICFLQYFQYFYRVYYSRNNGSIDLNFVFMFFFIFLFPFSKRNTKMNDSRFYFFQINYSHAIFSLKTSALSWIENCTTL